MQPLPEGQLPCAAGAGPAGRVPLPAPGALVLCLPPASSALAGAAVPEPHALPSARRAISMAVGFPKHSSSAEVPGQALARTDGLPWGRNTSAHCSCPPATACSRDGRSSIRRTCWFSECFEPSRPCRTRSVAVLVLGLPKVEGRAQVPSPALLTPPMGQPGTVPVAGTFSPHEHLVMRTENSPARNRDAAKPPADGNGVWIQTSATEVKGSGLHYQPLESPCPPEICHAHFEPFHFYGQV